MTRRKKVVSKTQRKLIDGIKNFDKEEKREIKPPAYGEEKQAEGTHITDYWDQTSDQLNPNKYFDKGAGTMVESWEAMEDSDPYLFGLFQTRILALIGLQRQITGSDEIKEITEFVQEQFSNLVQFNWTLYEIDCAIPLGYSVTEIVWKLVNDTIISLDKLKPRNPDRFIFSNEWDLKLITKDNPEGKPLTGSSQQFKWAVYTYMGKYGNRYGSALLDKVYWYWYFKKNATKFWAIFVEKFANPTVIVKDSSEGTDPANKTAMNKLINNWKALTGVRLKGEIVVELLEAEKKGTVTSFETFVEYLDEKMAVAVLGQPLTSGTGAGGTKTNALGNIHERVRQDILEADITFMESFINDTIIKWLVDYNFNDVTEYPKWSISINKPIDKKAMSEVFERLTRSGHNKIPLYHVNEIMDIPEAKEGDEFLTMSESSTPEEKNFREAQIRTYQKELEGLNS